MRDHKHIEKPHKIIIIFLLLHPDFQYVTEIKRIKSAGESCLVEMSNNDNHTDNLIA